MQINKNQLFVNITEKIFKPPSNLKLCKYIIFIKCILGKVNQLYIKVCKQT